MKDAQLAAPSIAARPDTARPTMRQEMRQHGQTDDATGALVELLLLALVPTLAAIVTIALLAAGR